jgi:hypothetical protein
LQANQQCFRPCRLRRSSFPSHNAPVPILGTARRSSRPQVPPTLPRKHRKPLSSPFPQTRLLHCEGERGHLSTTGDALHGQTKTSDTARTLVCILSALMALPHLVISPLPFLAISPARPPLATPCPSMRCNQEGIGSLPSAFVRRSRSPSPCVFPFFSPFPESYLYLTCLGSVPPLPLPNGARAEERSRRSARISPLSRLKPLFLSRSLLFPSFPPLSSLPLSTPLRLSPSFHHASLYRLDLNDEEGRRRCLCRTRLDRTLPLRCQGGGRGRRSSDCWVRAQLVHGGGGEGGQAQVGSTSASFLPHFTAPSFFCKATLTTITVL